MFSHSISAVESLQVLILNIIDVTLIHNLILFNQYIKTMTDIQNEKEIEKDEDLSNINVDWYNQLYSQRHSVETLYFEQLRECESNRLTELNASISIQKYFRMHQLRSKHHLLNHSAIQIQRIYRGYTARNYVQFEIKPKYKQSQQRLLYDRMATLIQKCFRGYSSRKNKLNFYARKHYIHQITIRSNNLLHELRRESDKSIQTKMQLKAMKKAQKFDQMIGSLHHLLSTKRIRGIFNSPFGHQFSAKAHGISIEQHIQQKFHHQFESNYYQQSRTEHTSL